MRVGLQVETNSSQLLMWMLKRLNPEKDRMVMVRPLGLDKELKETTHSSRLLNSFMNEASNHRWGGGKP